MAARTFFRGSCANYRDSTDCLKLVIPLQGTARFFSSKLTWSVHANPRRGIETDTTDLPLGLNFYHRKANAPILDFVYEYFRANRRNCKRRGQQRLSMNISARYDEINLLYPPVIPRDVRKSQSGSFIPGVEHFIHVADCRPEIPCKVNFPVDVIRVEPSLQQGK